MPLIAWKAEYSVGHPDLDADHENLVELINTLHDAWEAGEDLDVLNGIFGELLMYTDYHFQREERMLENMGYPALEKQKADHAGLRQRVRDFRARPLAQPNPVLTVEIEDFLKSWLMTHILDEDMRYKPLLTGATPER
jgi:hemerythrin-like metal-binding protein